MSADQLMTDEVLTVGQVAEALGVTVRTLHHYDEIGLVVPSERSPAGYRLYTEADLRRLQHVVVYRRLGFPLEQIGDILSDGTGRDTVLTHLRRQREALTDQMAGLARLVTAIDKALEAEMNDYRITREEQRELFGDSFDESYAQEAEQRWGDTDAWTQSQQRARSYSKEQWQQIKDEGEEINARYVQLMHEGVPADSEQAMEVAEAARQQICTWFYDCPRQMHAGIAEMYVADPRFTKTYEDVAPGLARYVRDAVVANAARG
ncbi:MerR family transcriptional regulator [Ornithinimicrobium pekingense]|uniref:HTH-type transcriptional activator TipA n=1 Tax=Ornithinimicrobium pekingense TaxID=384677 RepID=A0ABQ2F4C6_9MICO|nr:MerR family transcriptional regulator [Ornithinimicrobium pekingense]GGK57893.1 HTH-type transcriptional activator TipA [Ornithinimicrobium pekingense]